MVGFMSKLKRLISIFCITVSVALCCAITAFATESSVYGDVPAPYYSDEITLTVPALNGSISTSTLAEGGFVFKGSDDKKCTFKTITNASASGADARLLNSNGKSRSAWARNLLSDTTKTATTNASKGYLYYAQISSDLTTFNSFDITFCFSPDDMTSR